MKKIWIMALLAAFGTSILTGCGTSEVTTIETSDISVEEEVVVVEEEEEIDTHEGQVQSYLTGEWIDEELASSRPVAVMMSNDTSALPQYGIGEADIIYEAPAEGEINRFMLLIEDYEDLEMLMPIRSCRIYYLYWALGFDAIYVHYGQARTAKTALAQDNVNNLNGMEGALSNVTFFRDSSRSAPQNAYSTGEGLVAGIEQKGYDTEYDESYEGNWTFNTSESSEIRLKSYESSINAKVFVPGYSINKPWFVYNSDEKVYYRYQYGSEHTDEATGEQLTAKNILVQIVDWTIADSEYNYLDFTTTGTGEGYYITNGKAIKVTWQCDAIGEPTVFYDENGDEITLNRGRTWVCVIKNSYADRITFYGSTEDFTEP